MQRRNFLKNIIGLAAAPAIAKELAVTKTLPIATGQADQVLSSAGWMNWAEAQHWQKWAELQEKALWYGTTRHEEINKFDGIICPT